MKTRLIIAILLMTCTAAWAQKDVEAIKKAEGKGHVSGTRRAVVVGVSDYEADKIRDLKFAANDARLLANALTNTGLFNNVFLFADGESDAPPDRVDVLKKVKVIAENAGPNDMILFFFSGHGFPDLKEGHNYLAARDTDPDLLNQTGIALQDVYGFFNDSEARAKVILLDACHSGARKDKAGNVFMQGNYLYNGEGSVTLASSKFEQSSYEWPEKQAGVFSWFLAQGISGLADEAPFGNGDGLVTKDELKMYVTQSVQQWAVENNVFQTPRENNNMSGDVVLGITGRRPEVPEETAMITPDIETPRSCPAGMVHIPTGTFLMGSSQQEITQAFEICRKYDSGCQISWFEAEGPQKRVTLTKGFCMDRTEVTQGDYERVMGTNPSRFTNCGSSCPVESVSWNDAKAYCEKVGKRLPSEAEWEYAARGGSTTAYYWGDSMDGAYAWLKGNSGNKTHVVGQKKPNSWGLYDMTGNVKEWVADCYDWYSKMPPQDPLNDSTGCKYRVLRGGDYGRVAWRSRVSDRIGDTPDRAYLDRGFRCARD